jgi:hypothetical protein
MSEPALSIVVGSNGAAGSVEACLLALEPQIEEPLVEGAVVEVIVVEPAASPPELRDRFSFARFVERPGALVPVLWRDGIDAASGRIVALTISPMRPTREWVGSTLAEHEHRDVVAGAIEPDFGLRTADWAEYFCRYAPHMLPFDAHETLDLPGDNATYKRTLLVRAQDSFRDGFWEPDVHRRLHAEGVRLWKSPRLIVRQARSGGIGSFTRQRLAHGRAHGRQRGARFSRPRNLAGVLGAPLVPPLLTSRVLRETQRRRRLRGRALQSLPLILWFNAAWAAGEAAGHLDALRRG